MLEIVIGGIGYGLLLSIMVGPAFFILIETSIFKGIRSALYLDLGVLISDLIYITIAFMFFNEVNALMASDNRYVLKVIGGGAFIVFGLYNLLKTRKDTVLNKKQKVDPKDLSANSHIMLIVKGFMINALNPGVLFYWLTLMSLVPEAPAEVGISHLYTQMIYVGLILITFFGFDILKIIGAKKLKDFLTPSWIRVVNIALGFILILFGLLFLTQGIIALAK